MAETSGEKSEMKHLVRVASTELKGEMPTELALSKIKGVGPAMASAMVKVLELDGNQFFGLTSDEELEKIKKCLEDPAGHGIPKRLLNYRKDPMKGEDMHFVGPDLTIHQRKMIDRMKKIKSYRGVRHSLGLKVRGQRTKGTGRKGKTVGVQRSKIKAKLAAKKKEGSS